MTAFQLSRVAAWRWRFPAAFVLAPLMWELALRRSVRAQLVAPALALSRPVRWSCHSRQPSQAAPFLDPLLLSCPLRLREQGSSRKWQSPLPFAYGRQTLVQSCRPDRTMHGAL